MSRYYPIAPILCALVFSGCTNQTDNYSLYQEPTSAWVQEQNNTRLRSIESLIQAGKGNAAKQQADIINPAELTSQQQAQFNLLYAQIFLSFGEAEQAISKLVAAQPGQLSTNDKIKYFQSQAFAYSLTNNLVESAKARISLDEFLTNPTERKKNQRMILETLGILPVSTALTRQTGLAAWQDIAKILVSRNQNPASFNGLLAHWRIENPDHPANIYLETVEKMPEEGDVPDSIAILLPESGAYVDAAKAIKAGLLAAHSRSSSKPMLHFYDTENAKSAELYKKAVAEGAKLVIGPLNKDSIQALASSMVLTTPVLALNHVPNLSKQNLYQFALSPADDVAEITRKAALDGHKNAVLLVPGNDQSNRITSYFTQNWQMLNGTLLKKMTYDPKNPDFSKVVKNLLNFNDTESRSPQTQNSMPSAAYMQPNPENADVIFLSAYGNEGRMINAQLQAQQLGSIPVYAMPTIYSGLVDSINDIPLNGITFCDTPWLFNGAYSGELSMMALRDIWRQFPATYIRLVAMGIDAYQLAAKLTSLGTAPYSGATGNLSLDSGNRIKRNLVCAKFASGQPELIGFTHSPTEGDYSGSNKPKASTTTVNP